MKKYLPHLVKSVLLFAVLISSLFAAQATIISSQSGNWSTPGTWVGGTVPDKNDHVVIAAGHTVSVNSPIERNNTRTTTVNGIFQINPVGSVIGDAFAYNNGSLIFNHGSGVYDVYDDTPFWPAVNGPTNVSVNILAGSPGGVRLNSVGNVNRTVAGTLSTYAGIFLNNASLTLNGNAQINTGGYFANTPVYGPSSTLIYNAAGTYTAGNEWTGGGVNTLTAGAGVPNNVTVQNSTLLTLNGARGLAGNLLLQNGGVLNLGSTFGEDLYVKGNLSVLNTGMFNPNNRTVVFCRTGSSTLIQDINSTNPLNLHYVRLKAPAGGAYVRMNTPLNITAPMEGEVVQFTNDADRFYLNSRALTLGTAGKNNTISGTGAFVGSSGSSDLTLLGKGNVGILKFAEVLSLRNLTLNRESGLLGATLGSNLLISNSLNLQAGILDVYSYVMTFGVAASSAQAAPAAGNYIIADGDYGGALRKNIDNNFSSFTFPTGDSVNSAEGSNYSPITIDINNAKTNAGAYLEMKVFDKKALDSDTNFLSRYWTLQQSGITNNFKYRVQATYIDADVSGDEGTFFNSVYDLGDNVWSQQGKSTSNSNSISFTMGDLGNNDTHWITAGEKVRKREIIIRGNGIEIAPGDTTPDFFDNTYFGTATEGKTIDKIFTIQNVGNAPLNVNSVVLTNNAANPGAFTLITNYSGQIAAGGSVDIIVRFNAALPTGNKTAVLTVNSNDSIKPVYSFTLMGTVNNFVSCNGFDILRVQNFETSPAYPPYSYVITENIPGTSSIIAGGRAYANNQLYDKFQEGQSLQVFNAHSTLNFSVADLTASIDPYVVFNLAAFGYTNNEGPNPGDYVEVSVSTDGTTWYPQIRLNSGTQTNWNFGLQTPEYTRVYSTGPVSVINLGNGSLASANVKYVINNLPKVGAFYLKIELKSGADAKIWALDNVMIVDNTSTKTWTGTTWTGTDSDRPTFSQKAIINGALTTTPGTSFSACECEVTPQGNLTIAPDSYVEIQGKIINNGTITVQSGGNLNQVSDLSVNTGSVTVQRAHTLSSARQQYNFMASPVAGQNMKLIFGNNAANIPFVTKLIESTNYFVNATLSDYAIKAKGFAVKEPIPSYTQNIAEYRGVPNNGGITLPMSWTSEYRGYHLSGNPYPSNMDIVKLYENSVTSLTDPEIDPTFRFWDNRYNATYQQQGGAYEGYSYALYNAISKASTAAPGADPNYTGGTVGIKAPGNIINVSQGFMVRAIKTGASLKFKNSVRLTDNTGAVFYGKSSPDNRYRLQLRTSKGFVVQNAVAYIEQGSKDFGLEDTRTPNAFASDALFTYAGDMNKVVINGRSSFDAEDVLKIGTRHFVAGTYTIEAVDKEGVFGTGQKIYLKDKVLGIAADLSEGAYTFTTAEGEFTNRFEIVYRQAGALGTSTENLGGIEVYRDGLDFVVRSSLKTIRDLEIYDAGGRLILTVSKASKELRFNAEVLVEGLYWVKAFTATGESYVKKIRK